MQAAALLLLLVAISQTIVSGEVSLTGRSARLKTRSRENRTYTASEWRKVVQSLKPQIDNPKAKPIVQHESAGKLSVNLTPQIVGGTDAALGQFPWQTFLEIDDTWVCGGSLILQDWVLTAGHCAEGSSKFVVTIGTIDLVQMSDGWAKQTASNHFLHEKYDPYYLNNDIALLKMPQAFTLSDSIKLIALPPLSDAKTTFEGTVGTISGFGLTSDKSSISPTLKFIPDKVISNGECAKWFGTISITSSSLCTKIEKKASCNGDSGGPLVYKDYSNVWRQIGIVSFGSDAGCLVGPSVYTRVTSFFGWMSEKIGSDPSGTTVPNVPTPAPTTTKPPTCSTSTFDKTEACCNVPHAKEFVTFNSKDKSACANYNKNSFNMFNVYTLHKYQAKGSNAFSATDAKLSKDLAQTACFVNCYLKEKGIMASDETINAAKLGQLMNSTKVLGSSWNASLSAVATQCLANITSAIPNKITFVNGKNNCNGQGVLVVQCVLQKILESCPEIKQDAKCLKEYSAFQACANAVTIF